jgi:hypothetical protein
MNKVTGARYDEKEDRFFLTVQPGVLLSDLRKYIANKSFVAAEWDKESINALKFMEKGRWFYSTDPTETSASMGGIASCNASGARSYKYGSARDHITGLRLVLADGDVLVLKRGQYLAKDDEFSLITEGGREIKGKLPKYKMPHVKKNTSGYYNMPGMDMINKAGMRISYGFNPALAAKYAGVYYLLFALGRLAGGFILNKTGNVKGLKLYLLSGAFCILTGLLLRDKGLMIIAGSGFFVSVVFPTLMVVTNAVFKESASFAIGMITTLGNILFVVFFNITGVLNDLAGTYAAFFIAPASFIICYGIMAMIDKRTAKS